MKACLRIPALVSLIAALALTLGAAPAYGARGGAGCSGNAPSALDQYCEVIPSARGGETPRSGSPALGSALPARLVQQLVNRQSLLSARVQQTRKKLLTLPAPDPPRSLGATGDVNATVNSWSVAWPLILIMAAVMLAFAAAALAQRKRRRHTA